MGDTDLWVEVVTTVQDPVDETQITRRSYFVNERTKERMWDFPPPGTQNVIFVNSTDLSENNGPTIPRRGKIAAPRRQQNNDTWVEVIDHSGRSYFYSTKTNRIVWDRPPRKALFVMYLSKDMRRVTELCIRTKLPNEKFPKKSVTSTIQSNRGDKATVPSKFYEISSKNLYRSGASGNFSCASNARVSLLSKSKSRVSTTSGKPQNLLMQSARTERKNKLEKEAGSKKNALNRYSSSHMPLAPCTSSKGTSETGYVTKNLLEKKNLSANVKDIDSHSAILKSLIIGEEAKKLCRSNEKKSHSVVDGNDVPLEHSKSLNDLSHTNKTFEEELLMALELSKTNSVVCSDEVSSLNSSTGSVESKLSTFTSSSRSEK